MSPTRRAAVVAAGALLVLGMVALLVWRASDEDSTEPSVGRAGSVVIVDEAAAEAPFDALTAGTITVGDRPVRVVLADSEPERIAGLRGRSDARPYAGMLFVFDDETATAFTMAGVPDALDIAFFSADGKRVDRLRMEPCTGTDATCPLYEASGPFRYALETAPGAMPAGPLRIR